MVLTRDPLRPVSTLVIEGGSPIRGEIEAHGNKNAALPMLAACLLTDEPVHLSRMPAIADTASMCDLLSDLGAAVSIHDDRVSVHITALRTTSPDADLCQRLRASFVLAAPLLARSRRAELQAPGGDRIGRRPLDTHIHAFAALGVDVDVRPDRYILTAPRGLTGSEIFLEEMSVMATENVLMAATLARGTTIVHNAASEPHIQDLCNMLIRMGARIDGVGTNVLRVEGVQRLTGCHAAPGPDYIEVGSFIALAAASGGELLIRNARPEEQRVTANAYGRLGVRFEARGDDIFVPGHQELIVQEGLHGAVPRIHDAPWPGFPADLTSIALVLATQARGPCSFTSGCTRPLVLGEPLIAMGAK
jgi:UDP-N-acetylglucosamine 1-carboxyvinyltransferase